MTGLKFPRKHFIDILCFVDIKKYTKIILGFVVTRSLPMSLHAPGD